jgi:uncharacterized protein (DUF305 family)
MRTALIRFSALIAGALALAACGETEQSRQPGAPSEERSQERAFLSAMVSHHQAAIEMANAAAGKLRDPELLRLREAIVRTQADEIEQMKRIHRRLFGEPLEPDERAHTQLGLSAQEAGMGHEMHGGALRSAQAPVDAIFVDHMIPHHEGAIRMSDVLLEREPDAELRRLAQEIIAAQREEIRTMERVRGELTEDGGAGGEDSPGGEGGGAGAGGGGHIGH